MVFIHVRFERDNVYVMFLSRIVSGMCLQRVYRVILYTLSNMLIHLRFVLKLLTGLRLKILCVLN